MVRILCSDILTREQRPVCYVCGRCLATRNRNTRTRTLWNPECRGCREFRICGSRRKPSRKAYDRRARNLRKRPYSLHKKSRCEACGFCPDHPCQLDVDHIDGDRANNDLGNLQTLCANCHRLKTAINQDSHAKVYRKRAA